MGERCSPRALGDMDGEATPRIGGGGGGDVGDLFLINEEGGETVLHGSGALDMETLLRSGDFDAILVFREEDTDGDAIRHGMVKEAESVAVALLNLSLTIPSPLLVLIWRDDRLSI
jgi:hypothetical protein